MVEHVVVSLPSQSMTEPDAQALRDGFATFVAQYHAQALRVSTRLVGGDAAAGEDVAQEAFIRAYRGLDRFRGESSLATWFYRILVREAGRYRRWRAVRSRWAAEVPAEFVDPAPRPEGDPALRTRIASALERLSRGQREAFVFVHIEGFTVRETADMLGRSPGTIKTHLHRALRSLREELGDLRDSHSLPPRTTAIRNHSDNTATASRGRPT